MYSHNIISNNNNTFNNTLNNFKQYIYNINMLHLYVTYMLQGSGVYMMKKIDLKNYRKKKELIQNKRDIFSEKLFNEFPKLFEHRKNKQISLLYFGVECNSGWFDLIYNLTKTVSKLVKEKGIKDFEIVQIKEKFGGLRYYTNFYTESIGKLIRDAEEKSYKICEVCGKPGKLRKVSWYRTLCKDHWEDSK